ncbi:N-acetyltransferase [Microdochium nivale]|nr:N-acetyltransferase [Microdochium nivale]
MTTLFPTTPLGPALADPSPARAPTRDTVLHGSYVTLEPLDADRHAASLHTALCELPGRIAGGAAAAAAWPGWAYLPVGPFASEADFTRQVVAYSGSRDPFFYAVVTRRDIVATSPTAIGPDAQGNAANTTTTTVTAPAGSAVGWISFLNVETAHQSIEIGHICFSPALQRTAASTEAFYLMMRHAFDDLGSRRVEWKCDSLNQPSMRAAERLGFEFEGVFRKHRIVRGRNRDTAWYSVVDDEWLGGQDGRKAGLKAGFKAWLKDDNFERGKRQKRTLEQVRADLAEVSPP